MQALKTTYRLGVILAAGVAMSATFFTPAASAGEEPCPTSTPKQDIRTPDGDHIVFDSIPVCTGTPYRLVKFQVENVCYTLFARPC